MPINNIDLSDLPPARNGCYWFGKLGMPPAILPIASPKNPKCGKYMVYAGDALGFLFDGPELRAYDDPRQALHALRRALG